MRSNYIIFVLSVLTLGFGIAFWRASGEIDVQATHLTEKMLAAQEQARALSEELANEKLGRELALTAREAAERTERSAQEQLVLESKARETAERAHDKAADRAAGAAQRVAEQIIITKKLKTRLVDSERQLDLANAKIAARTEVRAELYDAKAQLRTLSAQLVQEINGKEAAEVARAKAEAEAKENAEKLALEVKRRKTVSNTKRAPLNRRVAFRRQKQAAAAPPSTPAHTRLRVWWQRRLISNRVF